LLLRWRLNISLFINRVELTALDRVEENLGCLLDTFEEVVVLVALSRSSLLVWMVAEDFLAMGTLDLF